MGRGFYCRALDLEVDLDENTFVYELEPFERGKKSNLEHKVAISIYNNYNFEKKLLRDGFTPPKTRALISKIIANFQEKSTREIEEFDRFLLLNREGHIRGITITDNITIREFSYNLVFLVYVKSDDFLSNQYTRGHEETHLLEKVNRLNLLEEELKKIGKNIKLKGLPKETQADIGGLYAVHKRYGIKFSSMGSIGLFMDDTVPGEVAEARKLLC